MACDICHRRKVRCDAREQVPCSPCRRANVACSFELRRNFRKRPRIHHSSPVAGTQTAASHNRTHHGGTTEDPPHPMYHGPPRSGQRPGAVSQTPSSSTSPSVVQSPRLDKDEHLTRSALADFYRSQIRTTLPVSRTSRWAYIGTTASNMAHLVNTQTKRPDCLHYPFPPYRSTLPWKPSASSLTARAIPVIQPQEDPKNHEPPKWTFTTLPDPDLGVLPVSEIREDLIEAYFRDIHPGFPVVQEAEFRRLLTTGSSNPQDPSGQEPPPLLLLQCVLLAGAHVSTHPAIERARTSIKEALYRRVRSLFDMRYENDRLCLLQAALILTWHVDSADDISANAWYWSGIASRIALGLGMHRRFNSTRLRAQGRRRMRSLWWVVVQTEVLCALNHGRPMSFDLDDCDQEMLTNDDLLEEVIDPATGGPTNVCTHNVGFCLANASLCLVIWEMLKLHSPGRKRLLGGENSKAMREAKMDMNSRLADWCLQLPPDMAHPSWPAQSFWAAQLHLHYYTAVITLNRRLKVVVPDADPGYHHAPEPARHHTPIDRSRRNEGEAKLESSDASLCHNSAVSILSILNRMLDSGWTRQCWQSTLTPILAAAIQFCAEIRSAIPHDTCGQDDPTDPSSCPQPGERGTSSDLLLALGSLDGLQNLWSISATMASHWSPAEGLSRLIDTILTEVKGMMQTTSSRIRRHSHDPHISQVGTSRRGPHVAVGESAISTESTSAQESATGGKCSHATPLEYPNERGSSTYPGAPARTRQPTAAVAVAVGVETRTESHGAPNTARRITSQNFGPPSSSCDGSHSTGLSSDSRNHLASSGQHSQRNFSYGPEHGGGDPTSVDGLAVAGIWERDAGPKTPWSGVQRLEASAMRDSRSATYDPTYRGSTSRCPTPPSASQDGPSNNNNNDNGNNSTHQSIWNYPTVRAATAAVAAPPRFGGAASFSSDEPLHHSRLETAEARGADMHQFRQMNGIAATSLTRAHSPGLFWDMHVEDLLQCMTDPVAVKDTLGNIYNTDDHVAMTGDDPGAFVMFDG
ncbi:Fungal Zn2-Cys6 binuclear cluster domain-containing protein [Cladophialophora immunda]|nr:Fungal Zn2-Cys6 binuclear cluster domain-containing protein [Cladophialophora immunda]